MDTFLAGFLTTTDTCRPWDRSLCVLRNRPLVCGLIDRPQDSIVHQQAPKRDWERVSGRAVRATLPLLHLLLIHLFIQAKLTAVGDHVSFQLSVTEGGRGDERRAPSLRFSGCA